MNFLFDASKLGDANSKELKEFEIKLNALLEEAIKKKGEKMEYYAKMT